MRKNPLGARGPLLSTIGFGCGALAGLMVGDDYNLQRAAISTALAGGITYFDTAAAYGDGRSEENLGRVLRDLRAESDITTKVLIRERDLSDIGGAVRRSLERSINRLGVSRLAGVVLHNRVDFERDAQRRIGVGPVLGLDDLLGSGGVYDALAPLLDEGVIGAVGMTGMDAAWSAIDQAAATGKISFVNASHSLADVRPSARASLKTSERIVDAASAKGLGVLVVRALAGGALASTVSERGGTAASVTQLAERLGGSLATLALRYVLTNPSVTSVIVGFSRVEHVHDALRAERLGPLDRDEQQMVENAWAVPSSRSGPPSTSGEPS